jgi:hypothetical protein
MLSVTRPINAQSISELAGLAERHPVFLLRGHLDDKVVVKFEFRGVRANMVQNARVAGSVDPFAKAHALVPTEVTEMTTWAKAELIYADPDGAKVLHHFLHYAKETNGSWVKMNPMNLTDLNAGKNGFANDDKSVVRQIAKALNAPGGMEKLGQIVAADLFNGNQDRFCVSFPMKGDKDGMTLAAKDRQDLGTDVRQLNHLINFGNVMIVTGPMARPVGLDAYDPNSKFGNLNRSLADVEDEAGEQWPGRLLVANYSMRVEFCRRCVADMNLLLGRRDRKLPIVSRVRLNGNAHIRMAFGIEQGFALIKNKLLAVYQNKQIPKGLAERFAILGWR